MVQRPNARERAFELASSGECSNLDQIRLRLKQEGYWAVDEQLNGEGIQRPLREACKAATKKRRAQAWRRLFVRLR